MTENCTTPFLQAYNPIFRTSSFYQILVSVSSIFPLAYFLIFKLLKSTFHGNLKSIFIGYFVSLILFSVLYAIMASIQSMKPFISITKCDLLVPHFWHKFFLTTVSFLITVSTAFPFFITFERYFAMRNAEKYEKMRVILGPILVAINVLVNFCIIFWIFEAETFSDPSVSFSVNPAAAAQKMFTFYAILFFLNIIDILASLILISQNLRLKKRLTNSSLSLKYQLEQVYESTKFSIFIILIHISLFGVYVSLVVFFRYFGTLVVSDPYNLFGVRTFSSTIIPTYHLAIGIVSIVFFNRLKSKKFERTTVHVTSIGGAGANNYDQAIFNIWNSVPTTIMLLNCTKDRGDAELRQSGISSIFPNFCDQWINLVDYRRVVIDIPMKEVMEVPECESKLMSILSMVGVSAWKIGEEWREDRKYYVTGVQYTREFVKLSGPFLRLSGRVTSRIGNVCKIQTSARLYTPGSEDAQLVALWTAVLYNQQYVPTRGQNPRQRASSAPPVLQTPQKFFKNYVWDKVVDGVRVTQKSKYRYLVVPEDFEPGRVSDEGEEQDSDFLNCWDLEEDEGRNKTMDQNQEKQKTSDCEDENEKTPERNVSLRNILFGVNQKGSPSTAPNQIQKASEGAKFCQNIPQKMSKEPESSKTPKSSRIPILKTPTVSGVHAKANPMKNQKKPQFSQTPIPTTPAISDETMESARVQNSDENLLDATSPQIQDQNPDASEAARGEWNPRTPRLLKRPNTAPGTMTIKRNKAIGYRYCCVNLYSKYPKDDKFVEREMAKKGIYVTNITTDRIPISNENRHLIIFSTNSKRNSEKMEELIDSKNWHILFNTISRNRPKPFYWFLLDIKDIIKAILLAKNHFKMCTIPENTLETELRSSEAIGAALNNKGLVKEMMKMLTDPGKAILQQIWEDWQRNR